MIAIQLDVTGKLIVKWPRKPSGVLQLARRYIAQQSALPVEYQLKDPSLAEMRQLLARAEAAVGNVFSGEAERATAAEDIRQSIRHARPLVGRLILRLKGEYSENLAQLENWGLSTVQGRYSINVRKPVTLKEIIAFLRAYTVREASLPIEQRIPSPSLAEVQSLLNNLETATVSRRDGREQREIGVEQREAILFELRQWLKVAATLLVLKNGGRISTSLQQHGFKVVERVRSKDRDLVVAPPPEPLLIETD